MSPPVLVLASASPRRRELLAQLRLGFTVSSADVDEAVHPGEAPAAYVERLAVAKARALAGPGRVVVGADTSVVVDGEVLGKPGRDRDAGRAMLRRLSGRTHQVLTGVAVVSDAGMFHQVVGADVTFRPLEPHHLEWYLDTGEGEDKAGGYAVQGHAQAFIVSVAGSVSAVIGLPVAETATLLERAGLTLPWSRR